MKPCMLSFYSTLKQLYNVFLKTLLSNSIPKLRLYRHLAIVLFIYISIANITVSGAQDIESGNSHPESHHHQYQQIQQQQQKSKKLKIKHYEEAKMVIDWTDNEDQRRHKRAAAEAKLQSNLAPRLYPRGKGKWGTVLGENNDMIKNDAHAKKDPQMMSALGIAPRLYESRNKILATVPPRLHPPKTSAINAFCEFGRPLHQRCGYKDGPCPRFYKCDIERGWEDYGFCCPRTDICMDNSIALQVKCGFGINCPPNFFCTISRFGNNFTGICCPSKKPGFCPPLNTTTATVNPSQPIIIQLSSIDICGTGCNSDFDCPGIQKCCDDVTGCKVCVDRSLFDVRVDLRVGVLNVSISQPSLFPAGPASITASNMAAARFGPLNVRQALVARARFIAQRQRIARFRVEQQNRIAAQRKIAADLAESQQAKLLRKRQFSASIENGRETNNLTSKAGAPPQLSSKMEENGASTNISEPLQAQLNELAQAKARIMALSSLLGLTGSDSLSLSNRDKLGQMNSLNNLLLPILAKASNSLHSSRGSEIPSKSELSYKSVNPDIKNLGSKTTKDGLNNAQDNHSSNHVSADHGKDKNSEEGNRFNRLSQSIEPLKYKYSKHVNNKNSNPFNMNSPVAGVGSI
ncbi:unnamed protein product [Gordionus sp. m RMFG-2023]